MRVWIDADASPLAVKEIVFRAAKRLGVATFLVANRLFETPRGLPMVKSIQVPDGPDEADRYIVQHAVTGDLAITADLPLANLLVAKGVAVIDPRGREYNANNIAATVSMRDFMHELRGIGLELGGPAAYSDIDKRDFAAAFDRALTRLQRQEAKRLPSAIADPNAAQPEQDAAP